MKTLSASAKVLQRNDEISLRQANVKKCACIIEFEITDMGK
ncbi:hypothetical protein [Anaplasma phagocytophilum]|nr:hypothetical protein [Anaplasma phagocytophilum]